MLVSCKTTLVKQYKITAYGKNYYTDTIAQVKDSVYFTEYNRDGKIRSKQSFKSNEVIIKEKQ